MNEEKLKVDRIEEGFAVCYLPDGGMTDIPLPRELIGAVRDGVTLLVKYDGDAIISVELCNEDDADSAERRARLERLFGRK